MAPRAPSVPTTATSTGSKRLASLWRALTEPSPKVLEPERRRRARLLAAILVTLLPFSVASSLLTPLLAYPGQNPLDDPVTLPGLVAAGIGLVAYGLSRTARYPWGSALAVAGAMYATWSVVFVSAGTVHEAPAPYFLGVSVILCSILLPMPVTVAVALLNMAGLLILPQVFPVLDYFDVLNPFIFLTLLSVLIGTFAAVRSLDLKQIRQQSDVVSASEERFRTLAENAPDTILELDRQGQIVYANRAPAGVDPASLRGTPAADLVAPEDRPMLRAALDKVFGAAIAVDYETASEDGTADQRWFANRLGPIQRHGRVDTAILVTRDITERVRNERERAKNVERAQELERLRSVSEFKTNFINMAAHELSTPMTPIKLQMHMLRSKIRQGAGADPALVRSVDILDRNVQRISLLLKDVLDGARIEAGRLSLNMGPTDVESLVRESVETHQPMAEAAGVKLEAETDGALLVGADAHRIGQVLFNLLSNALKFTPPGGHVRVAASRQGNHAMVSVTDTGQGLDSAQIDRLFQPFSQVHEHSEHTTTGTGLGLYICKGIVERHGGRIWVESPGPGKGASFQFTLPLAGTPDKEETALEVGRRS